MSDDDNDFEIEGGERVSKGRQRSYDREINNPYHPGMMWAGIALFFFMVYSLYSGEWHFGLYNAILLVVLALGSKALD